MVKNQEDGITILLGLKDYKVEQVRGGEDRVVVKVMLERREKKCPYCDLTRLYRHGKCKLREMLHSWGNGRKVYLELHRHRWQCRDCGHTFTAGKGLVQPRSRLTRQAETEALWQLRDRSFSQVTRELRVNYGTLCHLLERKIDEEALDFIHGEDEIYLGIDEHSFRHQELVHTVTEVRKRRVLGILRDGRIATLKELLSKVPEDKVKEVCIDMKEGLREAVLLTFVFKDT